MDVKNVLVKTIKTQVEASPKKITKSRRVLPKSKPVAPAVARKATAKATRYKTYPMSALKGTRQTRRAKLEPTSNPSVSPPMKRKTTIRVLTPLGQQKKEQSANEKTSQMTDDQIRRDLARAGHPVTGKAPRKLLEEIHMAAGMGGFLK